MDRRRFAVTVAALLLPGAALASRGADRPPLEPAARARLILESGPVEPNYLMVLNRDETLGQNLRKAVPQFDEARLLPRPYDDLSHPPFRRLLAKAVPVGTIHFLRNSLFVLPGGADLPRGRTAILHRDRAYAPNPGLQTVALTGRPERAEVQAKPYLGRALQSDSHLLLVIEAGPPSDDRRAGG